MKKAFPFFLLIICVINFTQPILSQTILSLEQNFRNPPVSSRPKALWPWVNGNVSLSQVTYELEEAKRKGMGGFDIWDIGTMIDPNHVVPAGPAFLGDESLQAIAYTIREADRIGLEIGLTFSSSWNAGGTWVKPEFGAMGLFRKDTIVKGPVNFSSSIPFPVIPSTYGGRKTLLSFDPLTGLPTYYKEVALLAHPVNKDSVIHKLNDIISLKNFLNDKNVLTWKVPEGTWRIVRYTCVPTGQPLAIPSTNSQGLMLDHFSASAQRENLNYIFNRLLPVTGSLKNRSLKYLYADSYEVNSAIWTPLLPEEFEKQRGYNLLNYLPLLDGFKATADTTERFLFDFRKTLSDLIIENHYALGRRICEEHDIGFVAEAGGPGKPIHNVPFEDIKALGSLTIPRGEFWNKHPQLELLQIIKGISSASHIYNQKYVEAESFTSVWLWQEGPDELKPLADRAMCEGLNRFVYHTFPHTPPESGKPGWVYNFGTLINTTNGWWSKSKGFHEYLARCSYLLQQGNFIGDVAYYYGDEAPNFVSPKKTDASLGLGYDYDVINTDILLNKMQVKNGKIYLPHGQYYEVLILPNEQTMNAQVAQKLQKMAADGATIIGVKPTRSYGLYNATENDAIIKEITEKLWGADKSLGENKYGKGKVVWGKTIREVLKEKGIVPDVSYSSTNNTDSLDFIHRNIGKQNIYFIRNIKPNTVTALVTFRVRNMAPELWDAETGSIIPIKTYRQTSNGIEIPLSFTNYGSHFIVFRSEIKSPANIIANNKLPTSNEQLLYTKAGLTVTANRMDTGENNIKIFSEEISLPSPIKLTGPWELSFRQDGKATARDTFITLTPLNESAKEGIKYFSGTVAYHHIFSITKEELKKQMRLLLDLGRVKEIAEVWLNGKNVGLCWHAPFQLDITDAIKPGENNLIIEVVNTPNNGLIGDAKFNAANRNMHSNITKLPNAWNKPFAEATLLDAGLIGPVFIRYAAIIK